MKKIFLLSLLSVFFLSAFSQVIDGNAEIITKINIIRSSDEVSITNDEPSGPETGLWLFFWRTVNTTHTPDGGVTVMCSGWGLRLCVPKMKSTSLSGTIRGVSTDAVEKTCENIVTESDDRASQGEYKGSLTKKMAFNDPLNGKTSYFIYQMNWDYDPKNPRNGTAEIIITKVDNLGIKY